MSNQIFAEIISDELDTLVQKENVKQLRKEVVTAYTRALAEGEIPPSVRDQSIGFAHGMARALEIVEETYRRMYQEDQY